MAQRGSLRASDADRERIVERLREATAEGRLAAHELEQRLATALSARTYAELDVTVADLPGKRVAERRRARVLSQLSAHPALILAAIPLVVIAVAILTAITALWIVWVGLLFLLGHRGRRSHSPWTCTGHRAFARRPDRTAAGPASWI